MTPSSCFAARCGTLRGMTTMRIAGLGFGIIMMAVGCGGGSSASTGAASEGTSAGGESSYAGPIGSTDTALGQEKYDSRCGNACHASGGGPELANIGWTPERMRRQIREGSGGMPAIGPTRLSDTDLEAVLAYLVTTGAVAAPTE